MPDTCIKLDADSDAAALSAAVDALNAGRLVILPTDTVYGVAAHPAIPSAVAAVYAAKLRDLGKPLPLLASSAEAVARWGARIGEGERRLAARFWPGPLTLVLGVGSGTEGFRVPDCDFTRRVIAAAGGVLRVTSANRSGEPAAVNAAEALRALGGAVALAVDAGAAPIGVPSTVARVEGGRVTVLREGALSGGELQSVLDSGGPVCDEGSVAAAGDPSCVRERRMSDRLVLVVCTANVCRSPMGEYLLRRELGPDSRWEVRSAGVAAGEGMPASAQSVLAMAELGEDLTGHVSQPLTRELVDAASLVVVMTADHAARVRWRYPNSATKVRLLKSFMPTDDGETDIPDPIGLSDMTYRRVRDEMQAAMPGLAEYLRRIH